MDPRERIAVALDVKTVPEALRLVEELAPYVGTFKIGLEFLTATYASLMTSERPDELLKDLRSLYGMLKGKLFWDGKWNDIPNTVAGAASGTARLSPKFFNVHASAGRDAVIQAVAAKGTSKILGVTVLTSIDPELCQLIFGDTPVVKVLQFAEMLKDAGADGVICSPQELVRLWQEFTYDSFLKVTPGVRPAWAATGDQRRVMTPAQAIKAGADILVIGRPITKPPSEVGTPAQAAQRILDEISSVA